jgi:tRNA-uridine 2-sulfurtransferase
MFIVGMSGGVDSSVAALLLKNSGRSVHGVFMHNWEDDSRECTAVKDRADALRVCAAIGIPFSSLNFAAEYKRDVFAHFISGYKNGWTPNPDILCNREIKFKVFLDKAMQMGATGLATGHYARKVKNGNIYSLYRAVDKSKDQSYFLHAINQSALARAEFPLGDLPKKMVRTIAEENNLVTANKRDSTGVCFIGERDFKEFLGNYIPAKKGNIVTADGVVIGEHNGVWYYTVGQRVSIGGVKGYNGEPWFIAEKNVETNNLIVVQGHEHPLLFKNCFDMNEMSWIEKLPPSTVFNCEVQIRHLGEAYPCTVYVKHDGTAHVRLDCNVRAVAAGQYGVLYVGDRCLGGGVIIKS